MFSSPFDFGPKLLQLDPSV